ncbi:MAG: hypothetical protein WA755_12495 [Candidatus Acidiferrales bacterium]
MSLETLHSSVLYLLSTWGGVTVILLVLLIYRAALQNHEDDQIFLDQAGESMAAEQRTIVARIEGLSRPIMIFSWLSGILLVATAAIWIWDGIRSF